MTDPRDDYCPECDGWHAPATEQDNDEETALMVESAVTALSGEQGVRQTIFAGREDDVPGNCLQAAVATYFGKPLDLIPHFVVFPNWSEAVDLWLRQTTAGKLIWRRERATEIPSHRCLVIGKSPRGVFHICVADGGRIVWDPHPSDAGLTSVIEIWTFPAADHG